MMLENLDMCMTKASTEVYQMLVTLGYEPRLSGGFIKHYYYYIEKGRFYLLRSNYKDFTEVYFTEEGFSYENPNR